MEVIKKTEIVSEKARSTRKRILEAAIKVFANKGYHETKVDDILKARFIFIFLVSSRFFWR
jgi:AcrR family transcriptional regulator